MTDVWLCIKQETLKHSWAVMMGSPEELQLLANMCKAIGAKRAIEIGLLIKETASHSRILIISNVLYSQKKESIVDNKSRCRIPMGYFLTFQNILN